jgi:hypothetical protein
MLGRAPKSSHRNLAASANLDSAGRCGERSDVKPTDFRHGPLSGGEIPEHAPEVGR